ncbi:universal stress protein [Actinoplanes solisilvae]|uniref:universal stress protein n=1 Tax=Actinoplanes solisilvae TaxID=2486853 RepID=UPI000FD9C1C0|nr:universal stress protein [Actinoplanes solisilvae]
MSTATMPQPPATGPVLVAVDDDDNAESLLLRGREEAGRLGVPMRVTYVWSHCRPPACTHHRRCHRNLGEASRLLNTLVDEHLTEEDLPPVERDVLHDEDPAGALLELSSGASLLVIGSASETHGPDDALGDTCRALVGRTRCPVAVVRRRHLAATRVGW